MSFQAQARLYTLGFRAENMCAEIVVDCRGHLLGRLASVLAKARTRMALETCSVLVSGPQPLETALVATDAAMPRGRAHPDEDRRDL